MRAARYRGARDVRIENVERSEVGPTDLRVAVAACGICGTDLHEYNRCEHIGTIGLATLLAARTSSSRLPVRRRRWTRPCGASAVAGT